VFGWLRRMRDPVEGTAQVVIRAWSCRSRVDRADPRRVKIRFDDMTTHREQARAQTEALVRARRGG
jgi:hypothetical protein